MSRPYAASCLAALMILSTLFALTGLLIPEGEEPIESLTGQITMPANNKGIKVFAEYVGGQNCPPCESGASPSLEALKNKEHDDFVFVSYIASNFGVIRTTQAGEVAPINRISHLDPSGSNSAPRAYFGDCKHGTTTCYQAGAGGTTTYDNFFYSTGGSSDNMHVSAPDYAMMVYHTPNGNNIDVNVRVNYVGTSGTPPTSLSVYAAVTEEVCNSYPYQVGGMTKPHHCWKAFLLNNGAYVSGSGMVGTGTGFETVDLTQGVAELTWTVPPSLVNGGANNMLSVVSLMSGWAGGTQYDVYTAADSGMAPPIDLGLTDLAITNPDSPHGNGMIPGDELVISANIKNFGIDKYEDTADAVFYRLQGSSQIELATKSVTTPLVAGAATSVSTTFDTTGLPQGVTAHSFRVRLTNLVDDGNAGNNLVTSTIMVDQVPTASDPNVNGSGQLDRGDRLSVHLRGRSNDVIDNLGDLVPALEVSDHGKNTWTDSWVSGGSGLKGPSGNQYYEMWVDPPISAPMGLYDVRVSLTDARSQQSDWVVRENAMELLNAPPTISPGSIELTHATVRVDTVDSINLNGIVDDAETDLADLSITSFSPYFVEWDASSTSIKVNFTSIDYDAEGVPVPQRLLLRVTDEVDETTSGDLYIDVIENGMPRWAEGLLQVNMQEGQPETESMNLYDHILDYDSSGQIVPNRHLTFSIIGGQNQIVDATLRDNQYLDIKTIDDDSTGVEFVTIEAVDGDQMFSRKTIKVTVNNVNDAPRINESALAPYLSDLSVSWPFTIPLRDAISDPDNELEDLDVELVGHSGASSAKIGEYPSWSLQAQYDIPGEYMIRIEVSDADRINGITTYTINIEVKALVATLGKKGEGAVDFEIEADSVAVGTLPTLELERISDLTPTKIEWQICDAETCFVSGIKDLNPADDPTWRIKVTSNIAEYDALMEGDHLKIYLDAVDSEGRPYHTDMPLQFDSVVVEKVLTDEEVEEILSTQWAMLERIDLGITSDPDGTRENEIKAVFELHCTDGITLPTCVKLNERQNPSSALKTAAGTTAGVSASTAVLGIVAVLIVLGAIGVMMVTLMRGRQDETPEDSWSVPADDAIANSMYGGAQQVFQTPAVAPQVQPLPAPVPAVPMGAPPLPVEGLPPGWTMDQWAHYGQSWLEQNGRA